MNKNFAVYALVMITLGSIATYSAPPAFADWLIDRSGTIVKLDPMVLGDDDVITEAVETPKPESNSNSTETQREEIKTQREQVREVAKQTLERQVETRKKIQEKTGNKSEVELRTQDGKFKLKQEIKDQGGRLIKKQEIEIKEDESLHVEQEDGETVRINTTQDGRMELVKNRLKTKSEFELKVGEKNEISVTLPNGKTKEVALPDKALERLVANGVIAQNEGEESNYTLIAGKNGDPIYQVEGQVEKKLLGLFKLKFAQKLEVAASTSEDGTVEAGDVVESESQETSPWRRFLERMSSN